jgi:Ca2+-transporting ATPase
MATKFGEIAKLTTETKQTKSPLQKELEHIGIFVTKVTGVICVILFVLGFLRDSADHSLADKLIESLMFSVSVAIAAVPEGLPTTITIALALGATILARKKAIVKRLSSVETLGAVTTICSDKTGTLTKNEMTVRELYLADRSIYNVSGVGYNPHSGKVAYVGGHPKTAENTVLRDQLYEICEKCNEAMLVQKNKKYFVMGDPTEGSLITLVQKAGFDGHDPEDRKIDEIFPFDSDRKMMSVITDSQVQKNKKLVLVKGSPD